LKQAVGGTILDAIVRSVGTTILHAVVTRR
jgi:hypothetical protein